MTTWAQFKEFFSNGGYATWVQTAGVVVGILIAYYTLRDTDATQSRQTTIDLARKYYSDQPAPALALLRLENAQLDVINQARGRITAYNSSDDDNERLLEAARPMLKSRFDGDKTLQNDYETMRDVYYSIATCVDTKACDEKYAGDIFGRVILRFYNASCPYIEEVSSELNHAHDNDHILHFLKDLGKFTEKKDYFCRNW